MILLAKVKNCLQGRRIDWCSGQWFDRNEEKCVDLSAVAFPVHRATDNARAKQRDSELQSGWVDITIVTEFPTEEPTMELVEKFNRDTSGSSEIPSASSIPARKIRVDDDERDLPPAEPLLPETDEEHQGKVPDAVPVEEYEGFSDPLATPVGQGRDFEVKEIRTEDNSPPMKESESGSLLEEAAQRSKPAQKPGKVEKQADSADTDKPSEKAKSEKPKKTPKKPPKTKPSKPAEKPKKKTDSTSGRKPSTTGTGGKNKSDTKSESKSATLEKAKQAGSK